MQTALKSPDLSFSFIYSLVILYRHTGDLSALYGEIHGRERNADSYLTFNTDLNFQVKHYSSVVNILGEFCSMGFVTDTKF